MTERSITQFDLPTGFIDLGMGNPDLALLPIDALRQSAEAYFSANDPRPLQYGIEQGNGYFRLALAEFLTEAYGASVEPDLLFVTSGASAALDLLCSLFTRPGEVIFVEEPSYFLALRIFEDHGLRVVSIPMDDEGLIVDALEGALAEHSPKFIYTIPTFQNPSGRTLTQARREKLVALAQQYGFLIIADEVYHLLAYGQPPPPPLAAFVKDVKQVISVNSFSKILAPGLRLGWIQAHPAMISKLVGCGMLDSGGGMNPFVSALALGLIETGGLTENIAGLRAEYSRRLGIMDAALKTHFPEAVYTLPKGGFFFWVRLPGRDMKEMRRNVKKYDVDYRPGALFSSREEMQDFMRLSFCFYSSPEIEVGIERLKKCLPSI